MAGQRLCKGVAGQMVQVLLGKTGANETVGDETSACQLDVLSKDVSH